MLSPEVVTIFYNSDYMDALVFDQKEKPNQYEI